MANGTGRLITEKVGDVMVVSFMDSQMRTQAVIERVGAELLELVANRYKLQIVIDFGHVEYLSSLMLGKLVTVYKRVTEGKGKVCLCAIRPVLAEAFKITRLDKVYSIYPDVATAIDAMNKV